MTLKKIKFFRESKFSEIFRLLFTYFLFLTSTFGQSGQIAIPRIEKMPNLPAPYNLRNWKQVARQYDSFVYDVTKTGQYLPLVSVGGAGIDYPQNKTIKLASYVGSPSGSEAINIMPSLVGASLVGIDKSNQFGQNWLLLSQDFFNKANGENIYLNNAGASSGSDGWYDVMPNIFFYQLLDLNPNVGGDAPFQFASIADKFLEAVRAQGGSNIPWTVPNMNYRAWKFKTMQGNASGIKEPEGAGAYAWILYNAWKKTGNKNYLEGAQWAMEFLNNWQTNPSYELQLPYATYTAAKMNAELGTTYDIEKMVNWSFNRGDIRGWGTIVGTWGGFDVSGLVGEANDAGNDYAFQLNGVQQAAALVPMVRYDKRFARAIGKWVLNLANATRLYYPGFLLDNLQDAASWSNTNDPNHVIGYEALRQVLQGQSPVSTGDALKNGWAGTNLALYGTSSIGYLGALMDETTVEKILKLDVTKTDFYRGANYPTYLLFNPNSTTKSVSFDAGTANSDIYEALSETFISKNVSGKIDLTIPANQAILVTITPANGKISYDRNKMLVNNIVIDYQQSKNSYTKSVRIKALAAAKKIIQLGDSTTVYATAVDPDNGEIIYKWRATNGTISGNGSTVIFKAPQTVGVSTIQLIVTDTKGNSDTTSVDITIVTKINQAPIINNIQKSVAYTNTNGAVQFTCNATDPNGDPITYLWSSNVGSFNNNSNKTVSWTAPITEGIYTITVVATDNGNLSTQATTTILVKNFNIAQGNLIAYYPFSGNTDDVSGNALNGQSSGIVYVPDRNGTPLKACYFNGGAQNVKVNNAPILNFQNAITVSCWFNAAALPDKETFLLSHGSWQNRWKISFTPDKTLRWTVNTLNAIADLDAPNILTTDSTYYITTTYDGATMALYLNGNLTAYKNLTGNIRTTTIAFMMGQMLPDISDYNFKGIIDEVKIYDYALTPTMAKAQYQQSLTAVEALTVTSAQLLQITPNPSSDFIKIVFSIASISNYELQISDLMGRLIFTKTISDTASDTHLDISALQKGLYFLTLRTGNQIATGRFVKL